MQSLWQSKALSDLFVHLGFLALFILATVFHEERLYADSGYYFFRVVNTGAPWIEHQRYVLALSQLAPWLGSLTAMPLAALLISYSLWHVLFHYIIYAISRFIYGSMVAGPILVLLQVLGLAYGFFAPMFELYYGAALLVLFLTLFRKSDRSGQESVALVAILVIILGSHPMAFFLTGFVVLLDHIIVQSTDRKTLLLVIATGAVIAAVKMMFASDYEQARADQVIQVIRENPLGLFYWIDLLGHLVKYYHSMLIVLLAVCVGLLLRGKRTALAIILMGVTGTLVLAVLQNYGIEHTRYQEQAFFSVSAVVCFTTGTALTLLPRKWIPLFAVLLLVASGYRLFRIHEAGLFFSERTHRMHRLIDRARLLQGQKFVVEEELVTSRTGPDPNWSYPIETLLLSSDCKGGEGVTICLDTDLSFDDNAIQVTDNDFLLRRWDIHPLTRLNPVYFSLTPGPYRKLNTAHLPDSLARFSSRVKIDTEVTERRVRSSEVFAMPLNLINRNQQPLPSSAEKIIYLSYHLYQHGEVVVWDGLRTPVETDVIDSYSQQLEVQSPPAPGIYFLVPDIVAEHIMWFSTTSDTVRLTVQ